MKKQKPVKAKVTKLKPKQSIITVTDINQTCTACPSQWEGNLSDGKMIYVRYRWGYLSIRVSQGPTKELMDAVDGKEVFGLNHGEGLDGMMSYKELTTLTKGAIVWPGKCRNEPGPLYLISFGGKGKTKNKKK